MRHRSCMPQLCDDATAGHVNRIGDTPPSANLLLTPQSRCISPTKSLGTDRCGLGYYQTRRGALFVILCLQNCGHVIVGIGPHPSERGHDYPVREIEISHPVWSKKRLRRLRRAYDIRAANVVKNCFSTHYHTRFPITITLTIVCLMQHRRKTILVDIVFFMVERYFGTRLSRREVANGRY
jgi:hypothetical protein